MGFKEAPRRRVRLHAGWNPSRGVEQQRTHNNSARTTTAHAQQQQINLADCVEKLPGVPSTRVRADMEARRNDHLKAAVGRRLGPPQGCGQVREETSPGNSTGKQAAWIQERAAVNKCFP